MSELREAAQEALFWMQHARLHLTIKERLHPDGLIQYDNAARNLRAALAQPKTKLRDQHKAFAEWFLQQNPIAPNVEDMAWSAWKAALAQPENRPCTCHPDDNPPQPCAQRYALTECKALAQPETAAEPVAWLNRHHAAMVTQDHATANAMGFTTPLYSHPPRDEWRSAVHEELFTSCIYSAKHARDPRAAIRDIIDWNVRIALDPAVSSDAQALIDKGRAMGDEWRPASDPPENGRDVVVWMNDGGHGCFAIGHCLRGEWTPNYVGSPVTHWRDIDGPTEGE